jgi:hypothetical protein
MEGSQYMGPFCFAIEGDGRLGLRPGVSERKKIHWNISSGFYGANCSKVGEDLGKITI